ncbi:S-adenosyl-L-methionine-dependent methyltransferase [Elaphomyces granulatus]
MGGSLRLRVCGLDNQILHHENSDYGTVLVLDNVIQYTERDEFSYLSGDDHPPRHELPKKVLVIGGGDGGVLREVAKHDTAILCNTDEFQHPAVKAHIGDGSKFPTDSSDPEGPAESFFQKPYFELKEESSPPKVILENQWLHIALISNLKQSCQEVFPVVEYAYTTIPTYPSGQIGFCKGPGKEPLRRASIRYHNKEIHRVSFVLPNFARKALL